MVRKLEREEAGRPVRADREPRRRAKAREVEAVREVVEGGRRVENALAPERNRHARDFAGRAGGIEIDGESRKRVDLALPMRAAGRFTRALAHPDGRRIAGLLFPNRRPSVRLRAIGQFLVAAPRGQTRELALPKAPEGAALLVVFCGDDFDDRARAAEEPPATWTDEAPAGAGAFLGGEPLAFRVGNLEARRFSRARSPSPSASGPSRRSPPSVRQPAPRRVPPQNWAGGDQAQTQPPRFPQGLSGRRLRLSKPRPLRSFREQFGWLTEPPKGKGKRSSFLNTNTFELLI